MMPPAPLTDDWLYWDPKAVASYPHTRDHDADHADTAPEQLDLFPREASEVNSVDRGRLGSTTCR